MNNEVLSLFSGIGAHDLGLRRAGWNTRMFCEIDPYCQQVLAKHWPNVPCVSDVTTLSGLQVLSIFRPWLVTGGFPCQDISLAGKGEGLKGQRSGLFFQISRLLREMRRGGWAVPWLLLENVPALYSRGYDRVSRTLENSGYECWPQVVGASDLGAPHQRQRVWIVARHHSASNMVNAYYQDTDKSPRRSAEVAKFDVSGRTRGKSGTQLADSFQSGLEGVRTRTGSAEPEQSMYASSSCFIWPSRPHQFQHEWEYPRIIDDEETKEIESFLGCTASGVAGRVARLKAVGNCNPPFVPEIIGRWILSQCRSSN